MIFRWGRAAAAGLLVVAACGPAAENAAPTSAPATTTTVPGDGGLASPTTATTAEGRGLPDQTTPTSRTSQPDRPAGPTTARTVPVGALGPLALRPGNGDRIVVEIRSQPGATPNPATIEQVAEVLRAASNKAVVVNGADALPGSTEYWTARSLSDLADRHTTLTQGGTQVVLRLLFLHGSFEGDPSVLGAAVRGDVAAMFTDQIEASAGLFTDPLMVQRAVTVHEVGHLLGLVDLVVGSGRGDPDHPGHSRNRGSVMYWAVEGDAISQVFGSQVPTDFDADDRAELATIRQS